MKKKFILVFLLLFAIAGYLRERFFEHLNIILASIYRGTDEYANLHTEMPFILKPLSTWSYATLYYSKYLFTMIWVMVFYFLSREMLKRTVQERIFLRANLGAYLLMLVIAGISMTAGYVINGTLKNDEYTLSRWLLGIAQSPIICLILTASHQLYKKSFHHDSKG